MYIKKYPIVLMYNMQDSDIKSMTIYNLMKSMIYYITQIKNKNLLNIIHLYKNTMSQH